MDAPLILYGLAMYALGVLTDNLVWRCRHRIERADSRTDAQAAAFAAAAAPLLALLDRIESLLRAFGPDCGPRAHASILTEDGPALDEALLALRAHLTPGRFAALETAAQRCTDDQSKADRQHCLHSLADVRCIVSRFHA